MLAAVLLSADSSASHKSDVWQYFTKDKERKKAKCLLCSKELAFHSGTTNLREHLMNRHSGSYKGDGTKKEKQGTLQAFARPKRYFEARTKEITDCIANFVALDMRPVRVVKASSLKVTETNIGIVVNNLRPSTSRNLNLFCTNWQMQLLVNSLTFCIQCL